MHGYSRKRSSWLGAILALTVIITMVLSACGAQATATPAPAPTSAPAATEAPAATTAPAATEAPAATAAPTSAPTEAPTTAPTAAPTQAAAENVTLNVWLHNLHSNADEENAHYQAWAREFESLHPGVKVQITWVPWENFFQKETSAIQAGNAPDIGLAGAEHVADWIAADAILPLDDVVQNLGGKDAFTANLDWEYYDGHYWSLPFITSSAIMFYRKDILDAKGLEAPKTMDDVVKIAQATQDPSKKLYGIGMDYSAGNGAQQMFMGFQQSFGVKMFDANDNLTWNSKENAAAITWYTDLVSKYNLLPPGVTTVSQYVTTATPLDDWYAAGQLVMTPRYGGPGSFLLKTNNPDMYAKTGFAMMPAGPAGPGSFAVEAVYYAHKTGKPQNEALAKQALELLLSKYETPYCELTGWPPATKAACPKWENEPWWKPNKDMAPYTTRSWGTVRPGSGAVWESYVDSKMMQDVLINHKKIEDAMADAEKQYADIFSRYGWKPKQ